MKIQETIFLWLSVLAFVSQTLLLPLVDASSQLQNQKNYYPPGHDPHPSPLHGQGSLTPPSSHHGGSGGCGCSPTPPAHHGGGGGGGYYHSPPPSTPVYIPPPTPTVTPVTPTTPIIPSPPVPTDPGSGTGPFPCTYWGSHPGLIWGVLGWWGTLGGVFGVATLPGVSTDPTSFTLQHALTNPRTDGYSTLYKEAAASFLNSVAAPKKFRLTTSQVRASFVSALGSDKAAASQARLFRLANEGRLKLD